MGKTLKIEGKTHTYCRQKKNLQVILKRIDKTNTRKMQRLYKRYVWFEDWQLQRNHVETVLSKLKWKPDMDAACDIEGSNKHFENYCSIKRSALLEDLTPYKVYCNPPFFHCKEFITKFEVTKQSNTNFKAVIILPRRKST